VRDYDAHQFRRRFAVGAIAFLFAFVGLLAAAIVILVKFALPQQGWFETIMFFIQLLPFILAGALGIAWLATYLFELPHYLLGHYHCHLCGRTQRSWSEICPCLPEAFRVHRKPRHWVHYRRRIKPVLMAYLGILGVVLIFLGLNTSPRPDPFVVDAITFHALLCVLVGVLVHVAVDVCEIPKLGRRFKLRATVFLRVYAIWPLAFAIAMIVLKSVGWA